MNTVAMRQRPEGFCFFPGPRPDRWDSALLFPLFRLKPPPSLWSPSSLLQKNVNEDFYGRQVPGDTEQENAVQPQSRVSGFRFWVLGLIWRGQGFR